MDPGQLSMVADKFQWVFSETLLNACGKEARFCRRMRVITPFRLGLALTATCASHRVETLADFHRGFNALFDTTITYKAAIPAECLIVNGLLAVRPSIMLYGRSTHNPIEQESVCIG